MSSTTIAATAGRTKARNALFALLATLTLMFAMLFSATPAHAVADNCDATQRLCGWVGNKGSMNVIIGTDYNGNGGLQAGAWQRTLAPGGYSGSITPRKDWDAVWVPAGHCMKLNTGVGQSFTSYNNRVGQRTGIWHKIDDFGAYVWLKSGSCP